MESFYDTENAQGNTQQHNLKRPLTLDLNAGTKPQLKKQKFNASVNTVSVLNSPDLQLLKLASPELEKFMLANNTLQTPTPSLVYPTKVKITLLICLPHIIFVYTLLHNIQMHILYKYSVHIHIGILLQAPKEVLRNLSKLK